MPNGFYEHAKQSFDYLRHMNTLSAGAIALQVGFLEKLFPHPKYKALVAVSVIAFTASILCSIITQWGLLSYLGHKNPEKTDYAGCSVLLLWVTFAVGLLTAVAFALINLFK